RESLDGDDRGALDGAGGRRAGANGLAVDMDGAGAALGDAAAEFGAGEAERVAQHPKERHVAVDLDGLIAAIDVELNHPTAPPYQLLARREAGKRRTRAAVRRMGISHHPASRRL